MRTLSILAVLLLAGIVQAADYGVLEETPNQKRVRLGHPIVESFPAPDFGEKIETPNARRKRLGLPPPEAAETGVSEPTPNQRRAAKK